MINLSAFLIVFLNAICINSVTSEDDALIISKKKWGARVSIYRSPKFSSSDIPLVVVHETGGPICNDFNECRESLQKIQIDHMQNKSDIIYNFLIGGDGHIYEGRGWYKRGAVVRGQNDLCISIAFIGNFTDNEPTFLAKTALTKLLNLGKHRTLSSDYKIATHKDFQSIGNQFYKNAKNCPGEKLFNFIKTLPRSIEGPLIMHAIVN